jgi:hypothetical protein
MYDPPKTIEWHIAYQRGRYTFTESLKYLVDIQYCERQLSEEVLNAFGGYQTEWCRDACASFLADRLIASKIITYNDASKRAIAANLPWYVRLERTLVRFPSHFKRFIGVSA